MSPSLMFLAAVRAESQKLRTSVSNVCSQAVTEIKQHWVASNTVGWGMDRAS